MEPTSPFSQFLDSNYAPTVPEIAQINEFTRAHQAILDSIELEIAALEKKRTIHSSFVRRHYALTTTARRLPEDILSGIFSELVEAAGPYPSPHPAVTASQVCQQWRRITLSTPRLWADISIQLPLEAMKGRYSAKVATWPPSRESEVAWYPGFIAYCKRHVRSTVKRLDAFIDRSAGCERSLAITSQDIEGGLQYSMRDGYLTEWSSVMQGFGELFKRFPKKWKRINLDLRVACQLSPSISLCCEFLALLKDSGTAAPRAEISILPMAPGLRGIAECISPGSWSLDLAAAGNLASLTVIMSRHDIHRLIDVRWSGLTNLSFGSHFSFREEHAIRILKLTPNLVTCSTTLSGDDSLIHGDENIPLVYLQSLTVIGASPTAKFATALDTPSLTRLSTPGDYQTEYSTSFALVEWGTRYGQQLEDVGFSYSPLTRSELIDVLGNIHNVTSLQLVSGPGFRYKHPWLPPSREPQNHTTIDSDVLMQLTPGPTTQCLCPKVESLALQLSDGGDGEAIDALVAMIAARRVVGAEGGRVSRLKRVTLTFNTPPVRDVVVELKGRGVDTEGVVVRVQVGLEESLA